MGFQEVHVGFTSNVKDFFKPRKFTIVLFLALVAGYNGVINVLFMITYPIDLVLNYIAHNAIGLYDDASLINNSDEWQAKYNLYRYGISIPVTVAFLYLLSSWVVYIMNNIGTPRNFQAIMLIVALVALYVIPFGYSVWTSQLATEATSGAT